jgi:hypothetical protein
MHRETLPPDEGMLFLLPRDGPWAMWMKDTVRPLDMLFIDRHGRMCTSPARPRPSRRGSSAPIAQCPPDERDALRAKLRAALRRVLRQMRAVIVPAGAYRFCGLQLFFVGAERPRSYVIAHQRPKGIGAVHSEGRWWATSLAKVLPAAANLDLRQVEHARRLEALLATEDPADLAARPFEWTYTGRPLKA